MPQFWEAAAILEVECILWVIDTISDGTIYDALIVDSASYITQLQTVML